MEDKVYIWSLTYSQVKPHLAYCKTLLNRQEEQRAERFSRESLREDFILTRGLLRVILASYLPLEAKALTFVYQAHGKPELLAEQNPQGLQFNVSHSKDRILLAIHKQYPVGVDIEQAREKTDIDAISQRFFAATESQTLINLEDKEKQEAFFRVWTRKEAVLKALGEGLSYPIKDCVVSTSEQAELISLPHATVDVGGWSLLDVATATDYYAAVAIAGTCGRYQMIDELPIELFT